MEWQIRAALSAPGVSSQPELYWLLELTLLRLAQWSHSVDFIQFACHFLRRDSVDAPLPDDLARVFLVNYAKVSAREE